MNRVTSSDGTTIAYDIVGEDGPPIVLIGRAGADRRGHATLATELGENFRVHNYDRRGRGDSGDTDPFTVDKEVDDLAALIAAAGGHANVFGNSSGSVLALEAAAQGLPIDRLVVWEPPYVIGGRTDLVPPPSEVLTTLLADGRRADAVDYWMETVIGLPPEHLAPLRQTPFWDELMTLADTLAYDALIMGDYQPPEMTLRAITTPTLVLAGDSSFPFIEATADKVAELTPNARRSTVPGQDHIFAAAAIAPNLAEFFLER